MKKFFLLCAFALCTSVVSAQEFVYDTFLNIATGDLYDLEVYIDDETNTIDHIFIEVDGEYSDEVFIKVKVEQLNSFHAALRKVKSKFLEWEQVAKDNGVTDFDKEIEVDFPEIEAYWREADDWKDSFAAEPYVLFVVDEEGDAYVGITDSVTDWEDDDYYDTYMLILNASVDFDDLINKTKLSYIQEKVREKNVDSLFEQGDNDVDALFT